jgi:hypothetical protein
MPENIKIVTPGPGNTLLNQHGETIIPPKDWAFLPAGDAGLTRKVTSGGKFWRVQFRKGRRIISKGIWAPAGTIENAKKEIADTRNTDAYKKKQEYNAVRRDKKQSEYKSEFCRAVEQFLNFDAAHKAIEKRMAKAVTNHAIPIGSGTVARTQMLPLRERAARAVIAWMRHNTTVYDSLKIKRIKGERRKTRRLLAEQSVSVLEKYRSGMTVDENCPLLKAVSDI